MGTGGGGGGGGFFGGGGGAGGLDAGKTGSGGGGGETFISTRATIGPFGTDTTGIAQVKITPAAVDNSSPTVTITTPANGATYPKGKVVKSYYYCSDPDGAANIRSCTGPAPWGTPIDTSTAGVHAFMVTATDRAGNAASATVHYTVAPAAGGGNPTGPPSLTALSETNTVFAAGAASTPLTGSTARARHHRGTTFLLHLDMVATLRIVVQRKVSGIRVRHRCLASHRPGRACAFYVAAVTLTRTGKSGSNRIAFSGRVRGHALKPGHYRVTFTASAAGKSSKARSLRFTIASR
jgi:hypothetical protein